MSTGAHPKIFCFTIQKTKIDQWIERVRGQMLANEIERQLAKNDHGCEKITSHSLDVSVMPNGDYLVTYSYFG